MIDGGLIMSRWVSISIVPLLLMSGCTTVKKSMPIIVLCETGRRTACIEQRLPRQAVMDAGAIVLGMRYAALRYHLQDENLP